MAHKREAKEATKSEQRINEAINQFEERMKKIEDFLGQMFGVDPNTMNLHFLLNELRTTNDEMHRIYHKGRTLEEFILENNFKDTFEEWQKKKREEMEKKQKEQCKVAGSGSQERPPDP